MAALALAINPSALPGQTAEAQQRDLNREIVVGASEVSFPYTFRGPDGRLTGFTADVLDAVAGVMNLRIKRVGIAIREGETLLRTGKIDIIQSWGETEQRRTWADFSVPVIGGIETVAVVRKNDPRIRSLADLKGRRVGVGVRGTLGWEYLTQEHPDATPVFTDSSEQFLRMLSEGKLDAAVMSRLTALTMMDRLGFKNLEVLADRIPGSKYDVRYCFAVRKGDSQLLARLNEGLAILHRTGQFNEIYRKWFGRYEPRTFRPVEVVSYVAGALALACIAAVWGFLRQRTLSHRIAQQAAELAEQRSLLAALHEKHPVAAVVLQISPTAGPVLVSANDEAARLYGLDPATSLPQFLGDLTIRAEMRAYLQEALGRWQESTQPQQWEDRIASTQKVIETAVVPLGQGQAGAPRVCVLSNDVTERRLMDHEIAQSRRLRALGELVGGIAHEFNNLLTPILLTTSLVKSSDGIDPEISAHLGVIENAARRAKELTRRLLTFGRRSDDRPQPVQLSEVVNNCMSLLRPMMDRRIEWSCEVPRDIGPVRFNPTDLNQVVFNLALNARDALMERLAISNDPKWTPRLRLSLVELPGSAHRPRASSKTPARWQRLTIEDSGTGIAPEIVDRIFEPFFTTKEVGRGTGLGLATVWHLVVEFGGEIEVESKLGEGTKFHLFLPAGPVNVPAETSTAAPGGPAMPRRGCRILLVEDEELVAAATMGVLRRHGHDVTHRADGEQGWAQFTAAAASFDVLLADINMPRMNGIDLVRRVRERAFPGKIIMMGGRVSEHERRALDELRVDSILMKPFAAEDIVSAIERVSVSPRESAPPAPVLVAAASANGPAHDRS